MPQLDKFTYFQYDNVFVVLCLLFYGIFLMEARNRKGKAVATTSVQTPGGGGHNGDSDDEGKKVEDAFRLFKIRQTQKLISQFLKYLTNDNHPFPRSPSDKEWLTVTRKVCDDICSKLGLISPKDQRSFLDGVHARLTIDERNYSRFPQFVNEMLKYLEEKRK